MLKVGNGQNNMAMPTDGNDMNMPPMDSGMDMENGGYMAPQQPQDMSMDNTNPMDMAQDNMGGDMDNGGSDYDTNFDAGVEADEDTDPKKYIQQLTGKLSTTLSKFNTDNGEDAGLSKYVAKMILKQAIKGMDEKGKKDLIKTINSADEESEPENDEPQDIDMEEPQEGDEMNQEPLQEHHSMRRHIDKRK